MQEKLFDFKVRKETADDGTIIRHYVFSVREPVTPMPKAECKMRIENGKIEDIELSFKDDEQFDIKAVTVRTKKWICLYVMKNVILFPYMERLFAECIDIIGQLCYNNSINLWHFNYINTVMT